jgi:hypothetical protein
LSGKHVFSFRRLLGVIIGAAPFVVVLLYSLSACDYKEGEIPMLGYTLWKLGYGIIKTTTLGYSLFALGGLISVVNFYLVVLRYVIHRIRHGKDVECKFISGVPLFGCLSIFGLLLLPKSLWLSALAFLFLCIDVGGIQWFVIFTWKDDSLWNPKKYNMNKNKGKE